VERLEVPYRLQEGRRISSGFGGGKPIGKTVWDETRNGKILRPNQKNVWVLCTDLHDATEKDKDYGDS
jgi:hypothetical protein